MSAGCESPMDSCPVALRPPSTELAMRYTPTLQDLHLRRIHIRTSWFTPRKCMLLFALSLIAVATLVRLTWTLSRAYSDLHSSSDTDGELLILPEDSCSHSSAFCLDGSRPGFYFRKGKRKSQQHWLIVLPGLTWCWTSEECRAWRNIPSRGSTKDIETTRPFSAILSASCQLNPHFCDWNAVLIVSCDGSSFLGNRSEMVPDTGLTMHMRGSAILKAVLDYLATAMGLPDAQQVVLYGQSSSALAAVIHVDYVRSLLNNRQSSSATIVIVDGGITLSSVASASVYDGRFVGFTTLHGINGTHSLHGCEQCLFVDQALLQSLQPVSPVVLLTSLFDDWSIRQLGPRSELSIIPPVEASTSCVPGTSLPCTTKVMSTSVRSTRQKLLYLNYGQRLLAFLHSLRLGNHFAYVATCPMSLLSQDAEYVDRRMLRRITNLVGEVLGGWPGARAGTVVSEEDDPARGLANLGMCTDALLT